jgi:hypothetical protein
MEANGSAPWLRYVISDYSAFNINTALAAESVQIRFSVHDATLVLKADHDSAFFVFNTLEIESGHVYCAVTGATSCIRRGNTLKFHFNPQKNEVKRWLLRLSAAPAAKRL